MRKAREGLRHKFPFSQAGLCCWPVAEGGLCSLGFQGKNNQSAYFRRHRATETLIHFLFSPGNGFLSPPFFLLCARAQCAGGINLISLPSSAAPSLCSSLGCFASLSGLAWMWQTTPQRENLHKLGLGLSDHGAKESSSRWDKNEETYP